MEVGVEGEVGVGYSMEELEEKVRDALRGTSHRSAPDLMALAIGSLKRC